MKKEIERISKLYLNEKLYEDTDEKEAGGYWDLAGKLADELADYRKPILGFKPYELHEQLQDGFYWVFQKILVKGERYR